MFSSDSVLKIFASVIYFLDIFLQLNPLKKKWMKSFISAFPKVWLFQIASLTSVSHTNQRSFLCLIIALCIPNWLQCY